MVPVHGLSKACRFELYTVFGVDESDTENSDQQVRSKSLKKINKSQITNRLGNRGVSNLVPTWFLTSTSTHYIVL